MGPSQSTAPIGDTTVAGQTNIAGFWAAINPASSGGLTNADNSFLSDVGDDIIFGHNNENEKTSADVPPQVLGLAHPILYDGTGSGIVT